MTVRVTIPPTMHRAEVHIAIGTFVKAPYMFWNGVRVSPEFADAVEDRLRIHRELDGYRYERLGDTFLLPPAYRFNFTTGAEERA